MRRYDEIQRVQDDGYEVALGIARDLLGLLLCVGSTLFLLFLARGL